MGIPTSLNKMGITNAKNIDDADYFYFEALNDGAVALNKVGSPSGINLKYSINRKQWKDYEVDSAVPLKKGDKIYFAGDNATFSTAWQNYYRFSSTNDVNVGGNMQSLLDSSVTENYTAVPNYGFLYLLSGCTGLKSAENLTMPSGTVGGVGLGYVFNNCSNLVTPPTTMPATTLGPEAYESMFRGCSSLSSAPELPATSLNTYAYYGMFRDCTSLLEAPELPATTLTNYCYSNMFSGCSSLSAAPELPATTLATNCYIQMFQNCTSITKTPYLRATALQNGCYNGMFNGCSSLSSVEVNFNYWGSNNNQYTYNWLDGVAASGEFLWPNFGYENRNIRGISNIPTNWKVYDNEGIYWYKTANSTVSIAIKQNGNPDPVELEYSTDSRQHWLPYTVGTTLNFSSGSSISVYFRNKTHNFSKLVGGGLQRYYIETSGSTPVNSEGLYGNLMALVGTNTDELPTAALGGLLYNNKHITYASLYLPATTVGPSGCYNMFGKCSALSAFSEPSYWDSSTNSQEIVNAFPATTLGASAYERMFRECTSLLSPVTKLPATNISASAYLKMYQGCTALKFSPHICATTLSNTSAMAEMFKGCSNLASVNIDYTGFTSDGATTDWLDGVANVGVLICPPHNNEIPTGTYALPEGWTVADNTPLYFEAEEANSTVSIVKNGSATNPGVLYAINNGTWNAYTVGNTITLPNVGDRVYFRSTRVSNRNYPPNFGSNSTANYNSFSFSGKVKGGGNIATLWEKEGSVTAPISGAVSNNYLFYKAFFSQTALTEAPYLTLTEIGTAAYRDMFNQCTSLTKAQSMIPIKDVPQLGCCSMFRGCTSLSTAPELPAKQVGMEGCYQMFNNCYALSAAPELPATTVAAYGYETMFAYCSSLIAPPSVLPASSIQNETYNSMFLGCTSLTSAPIISATVLGAGLVNYNLGAMSKMFMNCTSLVDAPALPATTLGSCCYWGMFSGCTSLTGAPALPATGLAERCYGSMFDGCTSLKDAPNLPATTAVSSCYYQMFYNCSSLSSMDVGLTGWSSSNETYQWLYGVAANGVFKCSDDLSDVRGVSNIPTNWNKTAPLTNLNFTALDPECTILAKRVGSQGYDIEIQASWDNENWWFYQWDDPILVQAGQTIYFKGDYGYFSYDSNNYYGFNMSGRFKADGSVMSLVDRDSLVEATDTWFERLFSGCSGLVTAPKLPETTLKSACYENMFENCTSLSAAPKLPATTLANNCYSRMFYGCTSLSAAPELPATTLANSCYTNMFSGCSSLIEAPALNATVVSSMCYFNMFNGCTSLTTPPTYLPATELAQYCYRSMFQDCTSLTGAPQINATTLANGCCSYMFYNCSGLTHPATLYATSLAESCYEGMYENCTLLQDPGLVYASDTAPYCCHEMYKNCASLTNIVDITATNLSSHCYNSMYENCTALTNASINGTSLNNYSLFKMFKGCSNLAAVTVYFDDWNESNNSTTDWLDSVASNGTFTCPSNLDTTTRDVSHVPANWTVVTT